MRILLAIAFAACASDPPAVAPNGNGTAADIPASPVAASASEVDLKRECVTGGVEDAKGAMKIICAPQDDCLNYNGRCYHKKK